MPTSSELVQVQGMNVKKIPPKNSLFLSTQQKVLRLFVGHLEDQKLKFGTGIDHFPFKYQKKHSRLTWDQSYERCTSLYLQACIYKRAFTSVYLQACIYKRVFTSVYLQSSEFVSFLRSPVIT